MLADQNLMNLRQYFAIMQDKRRYFFWVKGGELLNK